MRSRFGENVTGTSICFITCVVAQMGRYYNRNSFFDTRSREDGKDQASKSWTYFRRAEAHMLYDFTDNSDSSNEVIATGGFL